MLGTRLREQLSINFPQFTQLYLRSNLLDASAVSNEIEQIKDIDIVFHFASIVAVTEVNKNIDIAHAVNVSGTRELLKELKKSTKRPRFVLASSSHVYGFRDAPFSEDAICNPSSIYGKTKLDAEIECQLYAEKYDFDVLIGRIFSMWDHLQQPPFLFPSLRKQIAGHNTKEPMELVGANSLRDFQSASTVAQRLLKLSLLGANGVFNIASGAPMTVGKFACDVVAKKQLNVVHVGDKNAIIADTTKIDTVLHSDQTRKYSEN